MNLLYFKKIIDVEEERKEEQELKKKCGITLPYGNLVKEREREVLFGFEVSVWGR